MPDVLRHEQPVCPSTTTQHASYCQTVRIDYKAGSYGNPVAGLQANYRQVEQLLSKDLHSCIVTPQLIDLQAQISHNEPAY